MLATMTYSLEFLCAVVFGLMTGYFIFGGDSYKHAGSPCCTFFDDDDVTVAAMTVNSVGGDGSGDVSGGNVRNGTTPSPMDVDFSFPPQSIFSDSHNNTGEYLVEGDCCNGSHTADDINMIHHPLLGRKSGSDAESKENV
jgi:hypothetical protein